MPIPSAVDARPQTVLTGDSASIHRLIADLRTGTADAYSATESTGNRHLAATVISDGSLRTEADIVADVFGGGQAYDAVAFLPRERLLSPAQKQLALAAFAEVLETGEFTTGVHTARFENALAEFADAGHAIGTSSGTDAMIIALLALGVCPGDEVIMPANSFAATENAVLACGAIPVLADVDDTCTLDPADAARKVTARTRVILPVHLNGKLAAMPAIRALATAHGLRVLEDACQAIGVTGVGTHADAAVLSFNPYKNFGVCGKAGAVLTDDPHLADLCRAIGYHGFAPGFKNVKREPFGFNSMIDNTAAAVALALFPFVSLHNFTRAYLARRYLDRLRPLADEGLLGLPDFAADRAWHLFGVQVLAVERDSLQSRLARAGVQTDIFYPVLTHQQQTPLRDTLFAKASVPRTERLHARTLHLPLHHQLSLAEQDHVIEALYGAVAADR